MKQALTVEERLAETQEVVKVIGVAIEAIPRSRPINDF